MKLYKKEVITLISALDKLYDKLKNTDMNTRSDEFNQLLSITMKILSNFQPILKNNKSFNLLYESSKTLINERLQGTDITAHTLVKKDRLLTKMELMIEEQMASYHVNIYIHTDSKVKPFIKSNCTIIPIKNRLSFEEKTIQHSDDVFSILINHDEFTQNSNFDFVLDEAELNVKYKEIESLTRGNLDYYLFDKIYLEAKLKSLQETQVLLTGSSYSMCGLLEDKISLPAKNFAVDSQDIYYTKKSIEKALEANSNIKYCVMSFAYYLWGVDISLSNSVYQFKRMSEVNYPIFHDQHNFHGDLPMKSTRHYMNISPFQNNILNYEERLASKVQAIKEELKDANYYALPRTASISNENTKETNDAMASKRAASHNKFIHYQQTIKENIILFEELMIKMRDKGIEVIIYVPPVTTYYRNCIDPVLKSHFYEKMNVLLKRHEFKLIDLFSSTHFNDNDFYDYDHLNRNGAEKLSALINEYISKREVRKGMNL